MIIDEMMQRGKAAQARGATTCYDSGLCGIAKKLIKAVSFNGGIIKVRKVVFVKRLEKLNTAGDVSVLALESTVHQLLRREKCYRPDF